MKVTWCYNSTSDQSQKTEVFETIEEAVEFLENLRRRDSEVVGCIHNASEPHRSVRIARMKVGVVRLGGFAKSSFERLIIDIGTNTE